MERTGIAARVPINSSVYNGLHQLLRAFLPFGRGRRDVPWLPRYLIALAKFRGDVRWFADFAHLVAWAIKSNGPKKLFFVECRGARSAAWDDVSSHWGLMKGIVARQLSRAAMTRSWPSVLDLSVREQSSHLARNGRSSAVRLVRRRTSTVRDRCRNFVTRRSSPIARTLQEIEASLGRKRDVRLGSRARADLDLLLYDDLIMESPHLTLPHPAHGVSQVRD